MMMTLHLQRLQPSISLQHTILTTLQIIHIEVLQLTNPEITVDHAHNHPTDLQGKTHTDQVHIP